jgi:PAS domain-containing protein
MSTAEQYNGFARVEQLSDQVRECRERAAKAKAKANATDDPTLKAEFIDIEMRWLTLARNYEFTESLGDFTKANSGWPRRFDERLRANIGSTPETRAEQLGMISTHWREPHQPTERALRRLDVLARQAADLIERSRTEAALRESNEQLRWPASIVECSGDAIISMTLDGVITSWTALWLYRRRSHRQADHNSRSTGAP